MAFVSHNVKKQQVCLITSSITDVTHACNIWRQVNNIEMS